LFSTNIINHGSRQANMAQALIRWRHPVASSEAQAVLHWAMHPGLFRRIRMVIEIASNLPAFFVVIDDLFAYNRR
jgi:hypothetical protein